METRATRLLPVFLALVAAAVAPSAVSRDEREVREVSGAPDGVVWVAQLSDLHFSVHHPERAYDFRRYVGPALAMVNPDLVLITGDLTDGKSKDLLTMKQNEVEWVEYEKSGGDYDFYQKYSINAKLRRQGRVQSITLELCRALVKAYAMNPLVHAPVLFFFIPALMGFAIYKTSSI
nr:unnamed protein product [Digitaria exilis]